MTSVPKRERSRMIERRVGAYANSRGGGGSSDASRAEGSHRTAISGVRQFGQLILAGFGPGDRIEWMATAGDRLRGCRVIAGEGGQSAVFSSRRCYAFEGAPRGVVEGAARSPLAMRPQRKVRTAAALVGSGALGALRPADVRPEARDPSRSNAESDSGSARA